MRNGCWVRVADRYEGRLLGAGCRQYEEWSLGCWVADSMRNGRWVVGCGRNGQLLDSYEGRLLGCWVANSMRNGCWAVGCELGEMGGELLGASWERWARSSWVRTVAENGDEVMWPTAWWLAQEEAAAAREKLEPNSRTQLGQRWQKWGADTNLQYLTRFHCPKQSFLFYRDISFLKVAFMAYEEVEFHGGSDAIMVVLYMLLLRPRRR
ncbi:hypothetical protein NE237_025625 [Protea cynaroides]|uniref:Uncharacterized protein n=1 Tax=Protea cynaroides TaxID=273540 RepID=A0A9Q0H3H8_9MAGN|nr:hypothetical protein NE237_025625 [Protea cynaroides]